MLEHRLREPPRRSAPIRARERPALLWDERQMRRERVPVKLAHEERRRDGTGEELGAQRSEREPAHHAVHARVHVHLHKGIPARTDADSSVRRRLLVLDVLWGEEALVEVGWRCACDDLHELTLDPLPLCRRRTRLLVDGDGEPSGRERVERRLHVGDGASGAALAAHWVEAGVLDEHERVGTERLVKLTHSKQQHLLRVLVLLSNRKVDEA